MMRSLNIKLWSFMYLFYSILFLKANASTPYMSDSSNYLIFDFILSQIPLINLHS